MESADMKNEMVSWFSELKDHQTPEWDSLPDLDLYMDQVITYLERQMRVFTQDGEDKLITPSMINNYVKNEIIPRPSKKNIHGIIWHIFLPYPCKQVLPITDISNIIKHQTGYMDMEEFYNRFEPFRTTPFMLQHSVLKKRFLLKRTTASTTGMLWGCWPSN